MFSVVDTAGDVIYVEVAIAVADDFLLVFFTASCANVSNLEPLSAIDEASTPAMIDANVNSLALISLDFVVFLVFPVEEEDDDFFVVEVVAGLAGKPLT